MDGTNDPTWDWEAGELQAKGKYSSVITSYDYASPISEAGDFGQPGINGPNKYDVRGCRQLSISRCLSNSRNLRRSSFHDSACSLAFALLRI